MIIWIVLHVCQLIHAITYLGINVLSKVRVKNKCQKPKILALWHWQYNGLVLYRKRMWDKD